MLTSKFSVVSNFRCVVLRNFSFTSLFSPLTKKDIIKPVGYEIEIARTADAKSTLDFIEKDFFTSEPVSKSLKLTRNSLEGSVEIFVLEALKQGITLIAKSKNETENEIIGACVNIRKCPFDAMQYQELAKCTASVNTKTLFHIWSLLAREPRLHEKLNDRCIFEIKMLAVKDIHQCQGLGTELIKKSLELARDLNFSYAAMNCTSEYAKKIAEKQEMKLTWEVEYKNILLDDQKTPVSIPEHPHLSAAVSYLKLKKNFE